MDENKENESSQKFEEPDWADIFEEEVLTAEIIDVGYENANDIWRVQTPHGEFVVKITRTEAAETEENHPFWNGLNVLFGLRMHEDIEYQKKLARFINSYSPLKIPSVRRVSVKSGEIEKPYTVVECVPGEAAEFGGADDKNLARQLGEHLGGLHRAEFDYWGTFSESTKYAPGEWSEKLAEAMRILAESDWGNKPEVHARLKEFQKKAREVRAPKACALVFPDLRPSQFLAKDGNFTALVDIESHVVAPRELDLVAVEYSLETKRQVEEFKKGYEKFLRLPDISETRGVYRFIYFLIDILGEEDFEKWMNHEHKF